MEELIRDEVIAIIASATGADAEKAREAADRILSLEKVKDAFAAWWREESWSDIYDG
jgi:hypothetical protein